MLFQYVLFLGYCNASCINITDSKPNKYEIKSKYIKIKYKDYTYISMIVNIMIYTI